MEEMDEYTVLSRAVERMGAKAFFIAIGYRIENDDWKNGYRLIRPGSGYRNNIHKAVEALDTYLSEEGVEKEGTLQALCERYGFDAIVESGASALGDIGLKLAAVLQKIKAETISAVADALADGKVTAEELKVIIRRAQEDTHKTQALIGTCRRRLGWESEPAPARQATVRPGDIGKVTDFLDAYLRIDGVEREPILQFLCRRYGFDALPREEPPVASALGLKDTADLQKEKSDTISALADALTDGVLTEAELRDILREAEEDVRKTQALINACRRKLGETG